MSWRSPLSRAARSVLARIPSDWAVPILTGPAAGFRWTVGAFTHGCWLGTYESVKMVAAASMTHCGDVVFDVGANVGVYTLAFSRRTGPTGHVVAFEPLPRNLAFLRRHLQMNALTNVRVMPVAVSDRSGSALFREASHHAMGALDASGALTVPTVVLDALVAQGELPSPSLIKIDVEGAEVDVLRGARGILQEARPIVFVATHSETLTTQCRALLDEADYDVTTIGEARELIATPRDRASRVQSMAEQRRHE
jgi:FkbM family methyltransferase